MRERKAAVPLRTKDLVADPEKTLFKGFVTGGVACKSEQSPKFVGAGAGFLKEFL